MNENEFAAELLADGYTSISIERFEPRPTKREQQHHFAIRGLVLAGSFTVIQDDQRIDIPVGTGLRGRRWTPP
jgi:hypothetical protein